MTTPWKEQLKATLQNKMPSERADKMFVKYKDVFPLSYCDDYSTDIAAEDIAQMELLMADKLIQIDFFPLPQKDQQFLQLRLFQYKNAIPLSDILPIFENMDLRTFNVRPYEIKLDNTIIYISDFTVKYTKNSILDLEKIKPLFQESFTQVCLGICENDGFNKLVLGAGLTWDEITILRAYTKYLQQTRFRFSQHYIEKTMASFPTIAQALVDFFKLKHGALRESTVPNTNAVETQILKALENITSLDDDRIMRRFWQLIKATLRTNYFQKNEGEKKEYLSFKINSQEVPELPLPVPLYEIFIYSLRFEGIHLRSAKVARGGIRWSDRPEDFRTEILGLMKAQKVKNAVIVPSGAKGGFVLKTLSSSMDREAIQAEVVYCYKSFIRGLLDLTDNLKGEKVIKPKNVQCYDDDDPYLVVAADKGTATFSDIANGISKEYGFWLGDAFASGGSTGYDHKKMGITARGAWESIKRHFRDLNIDISKTFITVVGVGDMSGDVFGNGMLFTPKIKLIAAFDHRNIFLDPTPLEEGPYEERERLFNLANSSWEDYDRKLISAGGGVFKRSLKSIPLTPEIQQCLGIKEEALTPFELIRAILKAPVDLFFNGGIGTYVKSTAESHAEVGDKTNEFCRINGEELRCRVVGEGGNLGFTQLGRIEYALQGGLINTDFIDNSAGVDCSDHEVNIKILLEQAIAKGKLTENKRNALLAEMTQEVAEVVLKDNYDQAQAMSFSSVKAKNYVGLYQMYLKELETAKIVDREIEFLPNDKIIIDRKSMGEGLARPEIAVLLAYTKIYIKQEILKTDLPEQSYFSDELKMAFPKMLQKKYPELIQEHRLRREIIATQISNRIVNEMGITFIYRSQAQSGASVAEVVRAYIIATKVFEAAPLGNLLDSLEAKISASLQYELLHYIRGLLNISSHWFLRSRHLTADLSKTIHHFAVRIKKLKDVIPELMLGKTKTYLDTLADQFMHAGLNREIANKIAVYRALYISLNVIEISTEHKFDLVKTTKVYFSVGGKFNLVWFRDQISADNREGHWNNMARLTLRDELDAAQKLITIVIMQSSEETDADKQMHAWTKTHRPLLVRWSALLQLLHSNDTVDFSMFFVALRQLTDWVQVRDRL